MRLELERVGCLVQRDPHAEVAAVEAHPALGHRDVRLDEVQTAGRDRLLAEQGGIVLAEDAARQVSHQDAHLAAKDGLIELADEPRSEGTGLKGVVVQGLKRLEKELKT